MQTVKYSRGVRSSSVLSQLHVPLALTGGSFAREETEAVQRGNIHDKENGEVQEEKVVDKDRDH